MQECPFDSESRLVSYNFNRKGNDSPVFPNWPYDDALIWMSYTRDKIIAGAPMVVGCGEHSENIVSLGRRSLESEIIDLQALRQKNTLVRRVERGGGATVHSPGQAVVYPIVSLSKLKLTVLELSELLAQTTIKYLTSLGLIASCDPSKGFGVYVNGKKIASIGLHVHKGVITHGLALNVSNDLSLFDSIVTCGTPGRPMTSIAQCLGTSPSALDAARALAGNLFLC